eukprot:5417384-Pyramimonas_sp.AAC.1
MGSDWVNAFLTSAMSPNMLKLARTWTNIMMDDVCGVGAYSARDPESGSLCPWTHHRDLASGS